MMALIKILTLTCSIGLVAAGFRDVENFCNDITDAKVSYFVPSRRFQPRCSLKVNLNNSDVQQIRLDFESFLIAPPTAPNRPLINNSYQCHNDSFTVISNNTNLGFPSLCGENTGQHIYVNIQNTSYIILNFQLADNRNAQDIYPLFPYWAIRITQLEATKDASIMAPAGCLQYFTEKSGTYATFNSYYRGGGPYIGQTSYAICFQRPLNACGIRHTAVHFNMNFNIMFRDARPTIVCRPNAAEFNRSLSNDYLFIPGGNYSHFLDSEYYCGNLLNSSISVISTMPGPFYVVVNTDARAPANQPEFGFKINYQILTTGCGIKARFYLNSEEENLVSE